MAACLFSVVAVAAYELGTRNVHPVSIPAANSSIQSATSGKDRVQALVAEKQALQQKLSLSSAEVTKLQAESKTRQTEIDKLQASIQSLQAQLGQINDANASKSDDLKSLASERDSLAQQLQSIQTAYKTTQEQLENLKAERSQDLLRTASLELELKDVSVRASEEEKQLRERDQFLSSDRDIRELMGARDLYIADVFDVAENGDTQKPFGRVFYTKGKSLIFYAFDLDHQPHVQDASIFQAWGRRGINDKRPLNMGIFFQDSAANKRWVLRFDDPHALSQIDAVFVTVEARVGIQKPSGKQLLFASLRTTPNHP